MSNTSDDKQKYKRMNPERLTTLSDGVFAIVMTLLILNIKIPDAGITDPKKLAESIVGMWPKFESYAICFLILGIFWISHHYQFHFIIRSNFTHLWINIFFLMFVSVLPFSTNLAGEYYEFKFPTIVFIANLAMVQFLLTVNWWYATQKERLVDPELDHNLIRIVSLKYISATLAFIIAAFVALISRHAAFLCCFILPQLSDYFKEKRVGKLNLDDRGIKKTMEDK